RVSVKARQPLQVASAELRRLASQSGVGQRRIVLLRLRRFACRLCLTVQRQLVLPRETLQRAANDSFHTASQPRKGEPSNKRRRPHFQELSRQRTPPMTQGLQAETSRGHSSCDTRRERLRCPQLIRVLLPNLDEPTIANEASLCRAESPV